MTSPVMCLETGDWSEEPSLSHGEAREMVLLLGLIKTKQNKTLCRGRGERKRQSKNQYGG